jgi:predicted alpha/beta superfamily hydrolase
VVELINDVLYHATLTLALLLSSSLHSAPLFGYPRMFRKYHLVSVLNSHTNARWHANSSRQEDANGKTVSIEVEEGERSKTSSQIAEKLKAFGAERLILWTAAAGRQNVGRLQRR